ncbi:hypothetical protein HHX47_DHR2001174 [Lentinula edodes]|nr:hypothetical protein HHX47_DHR2001174 [Lentinula edodes]
MFQIRTLNELQNPSENEVALSDHLLEPENYPGSLWLMIQRATALYHLHDFGQAEAQFDRIFALDPYRIDDIDILSNILYVTNNRLKLTKLANEFLAVDKNRPEVCCLVVRPVQDYAKSCLEVAAYQLKIPDGHLLLTQDYLERVAASNAEDVDRAVEMLKAVDPDNSEALQSLASVWMSQQRPEDAKACLEKAWISWKDLDLDDSKVPPIPARLGLVRLFLELSIYSPALLVLHGVMTADDEEVEAWYLEGWCYFLIAEQAKENGGTLDDLSWEELVQHARDRLETCQLLHIHQEHPDKSLLEHTQELIANLEGMGIKPFLPGEGEDEADDSEWVDDNADSEDGDEDVEMS